MDTRITYEQIEKANSETVKTDIKGKKYTQVSERVKAFRKVYPQGSIETNIEEINDNYVRIMAVAKDENKNVISTGRASEMKDQKGNMNINLTSMIENCETSAVGRALGFAGFGIDNGIASEDEIKNSHTKKFEYATNMYMSEESARSIIKGAVMELMRKMGVRKVELDEVINDKLWTDLSSLDAWQLIRLESKLKTINNENNEWHHLYGQNSKIKDIIPKNTQVAYQSSWENFGIIALKTVGDNRERKNEIVDQFIDMGIDLSKELENGNSNKDKTAKE